MKLLSLSQIWRWDPHEDLCYSFSSLFSALINIFLDLPISASLLLLLSLFLPFIYSIQFLHWVSLLFFQFRILDLLPCALRAFRVPYLQIPLFNVTSLYRFNSINTIALFSSSFELQIICVLGVINKVNLFINEWLEYINCQIKCFYSLNNK